MKNEQGLPIRLMFQDEARFGRMNDPIACWAPVGVRPQVPKALVREYKYIYGAVSPEDGCIDWMVGESMKTAEMSRYLAQVSAAHSKEFVVMVLDGASSHKSKDLVMPSNISLALLPPYSPELNPAERIWDEVREKGFGNEIFDTLGQVIFRASEQMERLSAKPEIARGLSAWDWIMASIESS